MIPNSTAWLLLNAGIIKVNVTFYFYRVINSDTAFERYGSRIPIRDDLNTVQALKKHLVSFLGLKELSLKYGLREFEIKIYHMLPKAGGKATTSLSHWMNSGNWSFKTRWMAQKAK